MHLLQKSMDNPLSAVSMCDDNIFELERIDQNGMKFNHWAVYKFRLLKHYSKLISFSIDFDHKLYGMCCMDDWSKRHKSENAYTCQVGHTGQWPMKQTISMISHQTNFSQIGKHLTQIYSSNQLIIYCLSMDIYVYPTSYSIISVVHPKSQYQSHGLSNTRDYPTGR